MDDKLGHSVLVKPAFGIFAREAYKAWGARLTPPNAGATSREGRRSGWKAVRTPSQVGELLVNDLQAGCLKLGHELGPLMKRLKVWGRRGC